VKCTVVFFLPSRWCDVPFAFFQRVHPHHQLLFCFVCSLFPFPPCVMLRSNTYYQLTFRKYMYINIHPSYELCCTLDRASARRSSRTSVPNETKNKKSFNPKVCEGFKKRHDQRNCFQYKGEEHQQVKQQQRHQ